MSLFTASVTNIRKKTEKRLEIHAKPSKSFFLLITLASAIVSLGLALDNVSIVIGGMVVAPLITPIFGLSLRIILLRFKGIGGSLLSITLGTILAIVVATIIGYIIIFFEGTQFGLTEEILSRTEPNLLFFLVAVLSGIAGAYAYAKPDVLSAITGIAISVALIPPLAVTGIGIALNNFFLAEQSFVLYLFNLLGICFGSIIMFISLGFGKEIKK